jgi:hypothetical protein
VLADVTETADLGLNQLAVQFRQGMANATGLAGVYYVSTLDALTGQELCTPDAWIN